MYFLGVDIGSLTVKVVLLGGDGKILASGVNRAGYRGQEAAGALVGTILADQGIPSTEIAYTVATGYGRVTFVGTGATCAPLTPVMASEEISEISCQARGVYHLFPGARTIIDIGGQDSKAIRLAASGRVVDFAMNDKCAAGTGRFLEIMAQALEVDIQDLGDLSLRGTNKVNISSTCTVFAESETISHLARGADRADIAAGLHEAIASRVLGMASRVGLEPQVVLTGGVAMNRGVAKALEAKCGQAIVIPPHPQITGALGAALLAWERWERIVRGIRHGD
jgi:predicted CoA-substrate-specific enzyme activase